MVQLLHFLIAMAPRRQQLRVFVALYLCLPEWGAVASDHVDLFEAGGALCRAAPADAELRGERLDPSPGQQQGHFVATISDLVRDSQSFPREHLMVSMAVAAESPAEALGTNAARLCHDAPVDFIPTPLGDQRTWSDVGPLSRPLRLHVVGRARLLDTTTTRPIRTTMRQSYIRFYTCDGDVVIDMVPVARGIAQPDDGLCAAEMAGLTSQEGHAVRLTPYQALSIANQLEGMRECSPAEESHASMFVAAAPDDYAAIDSRCNELNAARSGDSGEPAGSAHVFALHPSGMHLSVRFTDGHFRRPVTVWKTLSDGSHEQQLPGETARRLSQYRDSPIQAASAAFRRAASVAVATALAGRRWAGPPRDESAKPARAEDPNNFLNETAMLRLSGLEASGVSQSLRELTEVYPPPPRGWTFSGPVAADECVGRLVERGEEADSFAGERRASLGGWRVARRFPAACDDLLVPSDHTAQQQSPSRAQLVPKRPRSGRERDPELEAVAHQLAPTDLFRHMRLPESLDLVASGLQSALERLDAPEFPPGEEDGARAPQAFQDPNAHDQGEGWAGHAAQIDGEPARLDGQDVQHRDGQFGVGQGQSDSAPPLAGPQDTDGSPVPAGWPLQLMRLGPRRGSKPGPVVLVRRQSARPASIWEGGWGALRSALLSDTSHPVPRHIGQAGEMDPSLDGALFSLSHALAPEARVTSDGLPAGPPPTGDSPAPLFASRGDFAQAMAAALSEEPTSGFIPPLARGLLAWRAGQLGLAPRVRRVIVLLADIDPADEATLAHRRAAEYDPMRVHFDASGNPLPVHYDQDGNPIDVLYDASGNPFRPEDSQGDVTLIHAASTISDAERLRRLRFAGPRAGPRTAMAAETAVASVEWAVNASALHAPALAFTSALVYTVTDAAVGNSAEASSSQDSSTAMLLGAASSGSASRASRAVAPLTEAQRAAALAGEAESGVATACRQAAESVRNVLRLQGEAGLCHNDLHSGNRFLAVALRRSGSVSQVAVTGPGASGEGGSDVLRLPAHSFSTSFFVPDVARAAVWPVPDLVVASAGSPRLPRQEAVQGVVDAVPPTLLRGWPPASGHNASAAVSRFGVFGRPLTAEQQRLLAASVLRAAGTAAELLDIANGLHFAGVASRLGLGGGTSPLVRAFDSAFLSAARDAAPHTSSLAAFRAPRIEAIAVSPPRPAETPPIALHPILLDLDCASFCGSTAYTAHGSRRRKRLQPPGAHEVDARGSDSLFGAHPSWMRDAELLGFLSLASTEMQEALGRLTALPMVAAATAAQDPGSGHDDASRGKRGRGGDSEPVLQSTGRPEPAPIRMLASDTGGAIGAAATPSNALPAGVPPSIVAFPLPGPVDSPSASAHNATPTAAPVGPSITRAEAWDEAGAGSDGRERLFAPGAIVGALGASAEDFASARAARTPVSFAPRDAVGLAAACAEAGLAAPDADRFAVDPAAVWLARVERRAAQRALQAATEEAWGTYSSEAEQAKRRRKRRNMVRRRQGKRALRVGRLAPHPSSLTTASLTQEQVRRARDAILADVPNGHRLRNHLLRDRLATGQPIHGAWGLTEWVPCGSTGLPEGSRCLDMSELRVRPPKQAPQDASSAAWHARASFFYRGQMDPALAALSLSAADDAWAFGAADLTALLRSLHLAQLTTP